MAVATAATKLAAADIGPARAEAEQLAAYVLGVPRGRLALTDGFGAAELARFEELVARRARREPLQHLLGTAAFRYIELAVGPGVFVPRPETELLAGWAIEAVRSRAGAAGQPGRPVPGEVPAGTEATVVDLCSGSGAIALAVANEAPGAVVLAVERSAEALTWLRRNAAERAGAGDRPIEVRVGDVTDPRLLDELSGRVDVLVCNPPYVPLSVPVGPEVAGYDPAEAVFGGPDGLAVIRPLVDRAARLLRPGGMLGIEHDDSHGARVPALLAADGRFTEIADHEDLSGRPRYATARRLGGRQ